MQAERKREKQAAKRLQDKEERVRRRSEQRVGKEGSKRGFVVAAPEAETPMSLDDLDILQEQQMALHALEVRSSVLVALVRILRGMCLCTCHHSHQLHTQCRCVLLLASSGQPACLQCTRCTLQPHASMHVPRGRSPPARCPRWQCCNADADVDAAAHNALICSVWAQEALWFYFVISFR
jgi:hypothetical protein